MAPMTVGGFPSGEAWLSAFDQITTRADVKAIVARLPKVIANDWRRTAVAEADGADAHGMTNLTTEELAAKTGLTVSSVRIYRMGLIALGLENVVGMSKPDREDRELHIPTDDFVTEQVENWTLFPTAE